MSKVIDTMAVHKFMTPVRHVVGPQNCGGGNRGTVHFAQRFHKADRGTVRQVWRCYGITLQRNTAQKRGGAAMKISLNLWLGRKAVYCFLQPLCRPPLTIGENMDKLGHPLGQRSPSQEALWDLFAPAGLSLVCDSCPSYRSLLRS